MWIEKFRKMLIPDDGASETKGHCASLGTAWAKWRGFHRMAAPHRSTAVPGFVASLPPELREKLISSGKRKFYRKDQVIHQRGDAAREFWIVETGSVQIGRFRADGRFVLFVRAGPGDSFGEHASLGEMPRMVDSIAGSDTTLIEVSESELMALLSSDGGAARVMLRTLTRINRIAFDLVEAERVLSGIDRVANTLAELCGTDNPDHTIQIKQQELADMIGLSRVALGRSLRKLEDQRLIRRGYGRITITDVERLSHFSRDFI
jgi:CRP-like cAMP-binding protein